MAGVNDLNLREVDGGAVLAVKAVPGASRDKIAGLLGDAVKVATSAPPEKGRANKAIAKTLAKSLGVSPSAVKIISGLTNPRKEFAVEGMTADTLKKKLSEIL